MGANDCQLPARRDLRDDRAEYRHREERLRTMREAPPPDARQFRHQPGDPHAAAGDADDEQQAQLVGVRQRQREQAERQPGAGRLGQREGPPRTVTSVAKSANARQARIPVKYGALPPRDRSRAEHGRDRGDVTSRRELHRAGPGSPRTGGRRTRSRS